MKILFDHQIYSAQYFGGISRYFAELHRQFQLMHSITVTTSVQETVNVHYHQIVMGESEYVFQPPKVTPLWEKVKNKLFQRNNVTEKNEKYSLKKIAESTFDIFHPTYYDPYFLSELKGKPFVVTVFDMIYELFPEMYAHNDVLHVRNAKKKLIESADHIIAISQATKNDIQSFYNVEENKISVIYLASTFPAGKRVAALPDGLPKKYLLFVGNREKYKNFQFFLLSIVEILKKQTDLYLVLTGPQLTSSELQFIHSLGVSQKIIHRFATDDELPSLYSNAKAFVFPSLYEGFGLPILEAFSFGCPCILANTSSMVEVAGDAALYFNPKSASEIRNNIELILYDRHATEELIQKGQTRLKNFSWGTTATQTLEVYKKVVQK